LAQIDPRERDEHEQCDDLLDGLQLRRGELPVASSSGSPRNETGCDPSHPALIVGS
jgi:hypothetical protein